jgi:hypothetical protein
MPLVIVAGLCLALGHMKMFALSGQLLAIILAVPAFRKLKSEGSDYTSIAVGIIAVGTLELAWAAFKYLVLRS